MSKKLIIFIVTLVMMISIGSFAFATEAETNTEVPNIFTTTETEGEGYDTGIPEVDVDDVTEWADRKGHQIITMLQRFAQPLTIIIFIGCAIITLIGAFGDSRMISKGIYGMAISLIVYAVILNSQRIMDVFLSFMIN